MDNQEFNINDLAGVREVIELACSRGAFRANEMASIGTLYNKLDAFLQGVVARAQEQSQANLPAGSPQDTQGDEV
jgi:hypothetical protein